MNLWPDLTSEEQAIEAARYQAGICFFISLITGTCAAVASVANHPVLGLDGSAAVDAAIFLFLGWRVWKFERWASITALVIYCCEKLYQITNSKNHGSLLIALLFFAGMVYGVRGVFAYKRLTNTILIRDR